MVKDIIQNVQIYEQRTDISVRGNSTVKMIELTSEFQRSNKIKDQIKLSMYTNNFCAS